MPKVSSVKEIKESEDDATIYAFKAVVKSMTKYFPAKEGDEKSQSFQIVTMKSGSDEIKAILRNRDPFPPALANQAVYFLAYHGDKGWSGLKAKDNTYKDTTERVLWVTRTAEVVPAVDYERQATETPPTAQKPPTSQPGGDDGEAWPDTATPDADRKSREISWQMAMEESRKTLGRCTNAMRLSLRAAENVRSLYLKDTGLNLSSEHFRVITSTFFMSLRDAEIVQWLPSGPVKLEGGGNGHAKPEPKPEPPKAIEVDDDAAKEAEAAQATQDNIPF